MKEHDYRKQKPDPVESFYGRSLAGPGARPVGVWHLFFNANSPMAGIARCGKQFNLAQLTLSERKPKRGNICRRCVVQMEVK